MIDRKRYNLCARDISSSVISNVILSTLLYIDPPAIIKRPASSSVKVGGVATFFCSARGGPQVMNQVIVIWPSF